MYKFTKFILILLFWTLPLRSYSEPHEYKATYGLSTKGVEFANSEHNLFYDRNKKQWCITTVSYTVSIFSLIEDTRKETSCFSFTKKNDDENASILVEDGYLTFKSYSFERIRSEKQERVFSKMQEDNLVSTFNEEHKTFDKSSKLDRLTAQMFGYTLNMIDISDKGRERQYNFEHIGDDNINTIFGDTKVKIMKKNIMNNKRSSLIWYSVEKNYVPVVIEQYRFDKLMFRATLKSYEN